MNKIINIHNIMMYLIYLDIDDLFYEKILHVKMSQFSRYKAIHFFFENILTYKNINVYK